MTWELQTIPAEDGGTQQVWRWVGEGPPQGVPQGEGPPKDYGVPPLGQAAPEVTTPPAITGETPPEMQPSVTAEPAPTVTPEKGASEDQVLQKLIDERTPTTAAPTEEPTPPVMPAPAPASNRRQGRTEQPPPRDVFQGMHSLAGRAKAENYVDPNSEQAILERIIREYGGATPDEKRDMVVDYGVGFLDKLATRVGQVADLPMKMDASMRQKAQSQRNLEIAGKSFIEDPNIYSRPGAAERFLRQSLRDAGMPEPDMNNFLTEVGSEQLDSLAMLVALRGAGPYLQKAGDANAIRRFAKRLGDAVVKKPLSMVALDVLGGTPGSVAGKRFAEERMGDSGFSKFVGSMAGATLGTSAALRLIKWAQQPGSFFKGLKRFLTPKPAEALVNENATPLAAKVFSEDQVSSDLLRLETGIQGAINNIRRPVTGNARFYQTRFYKGLEEAENIAHGVEAKYWNRVGILGRKVSPTHILDQMDRAEKDMLAASHEAEVPSKQMQEIRDLYPGYYNPKQTTVTDLPTIQKLRAMIRNNRRLIRDEWAKAQNNATPNAPLAANLNKLNSMLFDAIAASGPRDINMDQAIAMSREVYRMFGQGVIPRLLANRRTGEGAVRPYHSVDEMMKDINGLEDVLKMSNHMRRSAAWRTPPNAIGPNLPANKRASLLSAGERDTLVQLERDISDSIRADFHETVDNARSMGRIDHEEAGRILRRLEPKIQPMSRLLAAIRQSSARIAAIDEEGRVLAKGAFARYAGMDADKAIISALSSRDPAATIHELVQGRPLPTVAGAQRGIPAAAPGMASDPDAMNGLKLGVMNYWVNSNMKASAVDATKFQRFLATDKTRRILAELWTPAEIARLDKLVDIAVRAERKEVASFSQRIAPSGAIIARILGAKGGRIIGDITGQPTIQVPSILSRTFLEKWKSFIQAYDPSISLVHAMRDPRYEMLMRQMEPVNTGDGVKLLKVLRNHLRRLEGARGAFQDRWENQMLSEPDEKENDILNRIINQRRNTEQTLKRM